MPPGAEVKILEPLPIQLVTEPPGATVVFYPLDEVTGEPIPSKRIGPFNSPVETKLVPNDYLVVTVLNDGRFHEVYRRVPMNLHARSDMYPHRDWQLVEGRLRLYRIRIPLEDVTKGMTLLEGKPTFVVGIDENSSVPAHTRSVPSFFLDQHEVTVSDVLKYSQPLPVKFRSKAQSELPPGNFPASRILFDEAMMIAERMGKRLPTEFEYEFAATNGGTTPYPWGENAPPEEIWGLKAADEPTFDQTKTDPPIWGLLSNAAEFTSSWFAAYPNSVEIRQRKNLSSTTLEYVTVRGGDGEGGSFDSMWLSLGARRRDGASTHMMSEKIGFRCARSRSPRLQAEDF